MQINEETIYLKDGLWYKKDAKRVKEIERELKES
jgi:hypothetical protein